MIRYPIVRAIAKKELWLYFANSQSLILFSMTVLLNALLQQFIAGASILVLTLNMSLVMLGFYNTSFLFAEEKDKKTLDALLTAPISHLEIIFGKLSLSYFITFLVTSILVIVFHYSELSPFITLVAIAICCATVSFIGIVMGIWAKSQAEISSYGSIIMLFLFIPELLAGINPHLGAVARALPTHHAIQLILKSKEGIAIPYLIFLIITFFISLLLMRSFIANYAKQESKKWRWNNSNRIWIAVYIILMIVSSIVLAPQRGIILHKDGKEYYSKSDEEIMVPYHSKRYSYHEYFLNDQFVVQFQSKENKFNSLSVKALKLKGSFEEYLNTKRDKAKEQKTIIELDQEKAFGHYFEFSDSERYRYVYIILKGQKVFHFSLVWKEGKGLNQARLELEELFKEYL